MHGHHLSPVAFHDDAFRGIYLIFRHHVVARRSSASAACRHASAHGQLARWLPAPMGRTPARQLMAYGVITILCRFSWPSGTFFGWLLSAGYMTATESMPVS